ncbi:MAG TPA: GIY-YIG nuclease family protein [Patescibacteria group bacterium]|nr:GIY-YIG nuclease family protein [Patescibacteria group bacterium]
MQKPKNIPENPGVYQFKSNGQIIYVGKAKNLKNRLGSYFSNDLLPKTRQMVATADSVSWIIVDSELEALLLEANLVKKYQPKYNIELKDDKSPLYIGITKEKYPRIVIFRKTDKEKFKLKEEFGPYLSGITVRTLMRRIRRVFPFSTHEPMKRICIYKQIGLCDPCPSEIGNNLELRKKYLRNVRGVKNILSGKLGFIEKDLEKEIKEYAKEEKFEEAQKVTNQLNAFRKMIIQSDVQEYLTTPNLIEDIRQKEMDELKKQLSKYYPGLNNLERIECFDIAHLAGSFPTASMVVLINGEVEKKYYRHFKVNQRKTNSDVDSMREIITRRLNHLEDWGRPDLIIIDGGKPQLSKVHDLLEEKNIAFVGFAKQFETIVFYNDGDFKEILARGEALKLMQRIRDEAHRFARRLHHHQVSKSIIK